MERILDYDVLVKVPVRDNGEPLLTVQDAVPEILCRYEKLDMVPYLGERMLLRSGVTERLRRAALRLASARPGARFRLVYGYRHPEVQRRYFEAHVARMTAQAPVLSAHEIQRRAHLLSAAPDVAGHPTGGAVDITITEPEGDLDMGTAIADFSAGERIRTFAPVLTDRQRVNRQLLRKLLMEQGFAPFDGEWWHFSYGDREWAAYYEYPGALYDEVGLTPGAVRAA